jgi:hypothetical protein
MGTIAAIVRRVLKWAAITLGVLVLVGLVGGFFVVRAIVEPDSAKFGTIPDEAKAVGRTPQTLPAVAKPCSEEPADCSYFAHMDKGLLLKPETGAAYPAEILEVANRLNLPPEQVRESALRGQNAWIVWTGGNDRFWDYAARNTAGAFDLLKTVSSYRGMSYGRHNRWSWLGLVNEPCYTEAKGPDPERFGLWLDQRDPNCPSDPLADPGKYPGVRTGARGKTMPLGSYYGEASGVIGLRLFPNPDFDERARAKWDPERYYNDPAYYNDKDLVRPYRVGMSCGFCHVGPNPINPPQDPENPKWENLSSNPGAQYFWVNRIFFWNTQPRGADATPAPNEGNFLYQLFHTNAPGTLDTSVVSTDYMNNPRTMNSVYSVLDRVGPSLRTGTETLTGGERDNRQFQDYPLTAALSGLWDPVTSTTQTMRVLKDGADSVGTLGALNRVYLNIGLFSEEWLLHFRPFIGGQKISPIKISDAEKQSVYWRATEDRTPDMAMFFLVAARPDRLEDAPGGKQVLEPLDSPKVQRGQIVFAENCAACHSSKTPQPPPNSGIADGICAGGGNGPNYRQCWDRYWEWAQSRQFKDAMVALVTARDANGKDAFIPGNYLSSERRVPVDLMQTNACTATATNGLAGDIWDNFTSTSYKTLPPVKELTVYHPVSGAAMPFQPLGNGRGYLRPASLISVWATAPLLSNNSLGYVEYEDYSPPKDAAAGNGISHASDGGERCPAASDGDPYMPCVANRLKQFNISIHQLLNPDTRRQDAVTQNPVPGYMYRTSAPSCLMVPPGFVPSWLRDLSAPLHWLAPWAVGRDGGIALGPFPKGFPINALANTKLLPDNDETGALGHYWRLLGAAPTLVSAFRAMGGTCSPEALADPGTEVTAEAAVRDTHLIDTLVGLSKCPDYIVNRGHYFGADLSADDKDALIAYIMHF